MINSKGDINTKFVQLKPLRELEEIEGDYSAVIQGDVPVKNKDNYFHFKLKNMSHVTDPIIHLKQIYPNTLRLVISLLKIIINQRTQILKLQMTLQ